MFEPYRLPLSLLMLTSSGCALASVPTVYAIDPAASTVEIASRDSLRPFEASIHDIAGSLRLTSDASAPRSLDLVFDLSSLDSGDRSQNQLLLSPKYLWVDHHRYGLTLAPDVSASGAGSFLAQTTLALRNVSCQVPVAFNWRLADEAGAPVAYLRGSTEVSARDFGIESSDPWERKLKITYELRLKPVAGKVESVTRWGPDAVTDDNYPPPRCSSTGWPIGAARAPELIRAAEAGG